MNVLQMKHGLVAVSLALAASVTFYSCDQAGAATGRKINGTWQLISGMTITKKDTARYPKDFKMIKVINNTHFAFLRHDLNPPKDSSNHFDAGGGSYTLNGDQYTEHLDYYIDRNWEGKPFKFTIQIKDDTLTQTGVEKVDAAGINRIIVEKYVRVGAGN